MSARDTSGSAPQHSHPHNNTMSRNEKFWVDQVMPPRNDKGGGGHKALVVGSVGSDREGGVKQKNSPLPYALKQNLRRPQNLLFHATFWSL